MNITKIVGLLLFTVLLAVNSFGLNVLIVFPHIWRSPNFIGSAMAKSLAKVGHNVTFISLYPIDNSPKNIRYIRLDGIFEMMNENMVAFKGQFLRISVIRLLYYLQHFGTQISEIIFNNPKVKDLMKNEMFDAVILDIFGTDSLIALGQHFNAPVIGIATLGATTWINSLTGNTSPLSYIPHPFLDHSSHMSIFQRFKSLAMMAYEYFLFNCISNPEHERIYKTYFPKAVSSYSDLYYHGLSLMFMNTHVATNPIKPYLPNTINIAGIHIPREGSSLPREILDFIDSAEHGVIYVSLGTNMNSVNFPKQNQLDFINVFSKLKEKVLWKFDKTDFENIPDNLLIETWVPQIDVLAHPNVKIFITHGGLLSLTESIYHNVPVIGIPVFGDQKHNIAHAKYKGWGYLLDFKTLSEATILNAINTVLTNTSYTENMNRTSIIFRDQPMSPSKLVVYWVEYVVRHKGAPHLQPSGKYLTFFEYYMIDVFAVLLLILVLCTALCVIVLRILLKNIFFKLGLIFKRKIE